MKSGERKTGRKGKINFQYMWASVNPTQCKEVKKKFLTYFRQEDMIT